jgi:hypothetical protein
MMAMTTNSSTKVKPVHWLRLLRGLAAHFMINPLPKGSLDVKSNATKNKL